jgi:tetratricopeptide (TPR) repeat protein
MHALLLIAVLHGAPADDVNEDLQRAATALALNRLEDAAAAYQAALKKVPDSIPAHNGLGIALFRAGKRAEGISEFKAAIAADPKGAVAHLNLAFGSRKMADYGTAVAEYEAYIAIAPQDPDGYYGLGETRRLQGEPVHALEALRKYVEVEKRPSEVRWVERAKAAIPGLESEVKQRQEALAAQEAAAAEGEKADAEEPAPSSEHSVAGAPSPAAGPAVAANR